MQFEINSTNALLDLMNRFKYPSVKAGVHVVHGRHGELFVTARSPEAWKHWAYTNGYDDYNTFIDEWEDQMEWSQDGRKGWIDDGGSIEYIEVEGYYRDGVNFL